MSRDDAFKLLGGYATGTLTPAERDALFAAAMEDQALFDALAGEEALRELLADEGARRRLERELEPQSKQKTWWLWAPAAAVAMGILIVSAVWITEPWRPAPVQMARAVHPPPREFVPPETPRANVVDSTPPPVAAEPKEDLRKPAPKALMAEAAQRPAPLPPPRLARMEQAVSVTAAAPSASEFRAKMAGGNLTGAAAADMAVMLPRTLVMKRGDNHAYLQAPPSAVFHAGDAVKLQIAARRAGRLTVTDVAGTVIFSGTVAAGATLLLPDGAPILLAGPKVFSVQWDDAPASQVILRFE